MSKFYFIGIKGAGMSALASMLYDQGHQVKGSDYEEDFYTTIGLKKRQIDIELLEEMTIEDDMTLIVGNAFVNHELVLAYKEKGLKTYTYSEYLGRLSKDLFSIAITGAHGKTTTTNLCRQLLERHESINYIVGDGVGAGSKKSNKVIFEACEYKRHFLHYFPKVAVITNIDYDHPDYYRDINDVCRAFTDFMHNSNFIIYNGDDLYLRELTEDTHLKLSYGLNHDNDFYADNINHNSEYTTFDVYCNRELLDTYKIPLFGNHNVYNALAAIAFSKYMGVSNDIIKTGLKCYETSKRRFEIIYLKKQIIVSDYAHHPTEIKATYHALKQKFSKKKIICVFEPHTFSRTERFIEAFKEALEHYDHVYLKSIFTSVRETDETVTIYDLSQLITDSKVITDEELNVLKQYDDSVIVFMGAGNIDKTAQLYVQNQQNK